MTRPSGIPVEDMHSMDDRRHSPMQRPWAWDGKLREPLGVEHNSYPSATPGPQDDVGNVRSSGRRVDARLDCVPFDREVVAEQTPEVVIPEVVGWIDAT